MTAREAFPVCNHCQVHLSISHILVECPTYSVPRNRFFPSLTSVPHSERLPLLLSESSTFTQTPRHHQPLHFFYSSSLLSSFLHFTKHIRPIHTLNQFFLSHSFYNPVILIHFTALFFTSFMLHIFIKNIISNTSNFLLF